MPPTNLSALQLAILEDLRQIKAEAGPNAVRAIIDLARTGRQPPPLIVERLRRSPMANYYVYQEREKLKLFGGTERIALTRFHCKDGEIFVLSPLAAPPPPRDAALRGQRSS